MKEAYVSYEVAKLLKEKGFDWHTHNFYDETECRSFEDLLCDWNHSTISNVSCPTQQMAMRWLREEKGMHIYPIPANGYYYWAYIYIENGNRTLNRVLSRNGRKAYEDTIEAALEYCLTNLI